MDTIVANADLINGTGGIQPTNQSQKFEALMQHQPGGRFSDVYTDEVAAPSTAARGVMLSPEIAAAGKALSDNLKVAMSAPAKLSETPVTDPDIAVLRAGLTDYLHFQGSMVQFSMTMKSVELSVQGFQSIYKMQG